MKTGQKALVRLKPSPKCYYILCIKEKKKFWVPFLFVSQEEMPKKKKATSRRRTNTKVGEDYKYENRVWYALLNESSGEYYEVLGQDVENFKDYEC